jgi:hypothetical protein
MLSDLVTKFKGNTFNVSPCDKETCETLLRSSSSDANTVCRRCKLKSFGVNAKCNPLKLRLRKLKSTKQSNKYVSYPHVAYSDSETDLSGDSTLQKPFEKFAPSHHTYNTKLVDETTKKIKQGKDNLKKLSGRHCKLICTKNCSSLSCCLHNTWQNKKPYKSKLQWTSESESSTYKSIKKSNWGGVDIFVCRPYDNHETHFYKRIQGFVTKREEERPAQIQCRYLTLPCGLDPYIPLAKQALTVKYLNQLPALLRKIPLIEKTLLTLEFFRAVPGELSRAPCEARVFIPSSTLLILLRSKYTTLHSKYRLLMHLLKPSSEDASVAILELPLSLFSAELQPPQSMKMSNKRLLYAAKRVANGYVDKKLTALLRFQHQTLFNSSDKSLTEIPNKIYSIASNSVSIASNSNSFVSNSSSFVSNSNSFVSNSNSFVSNSGRFASNSDGFTSNSNSFAYNVKSLSFDEELESLSSKSSRLGWKKKKSEPFSKRAIGKGNNFLIKKDKVQPQRSINASVLDEKMKPTLKCSSWSSFLWMLTSGWQFFVACISMVPMTLLCFMTFLHFGKIK